MASSVQSATRQRNIDPMQGIIDGELDKKQLSSGRNKISLKRVCGRKQRVKIDSHSPIRQCDQSQCEFKYVG